MKKTLYISDLDQTLLQPGGRLSSFATRNLNNMIDKGINFTVASARSVVSQQLILGELDLKLPVIEFNGSFISDLKTGRHLVINRLSPSALSAAADLFDSKGFHYFLSTFDGQQDRLYYSRTDNDGERWYVEDRRRAGDHRLSETLDRRDHFNESAVCLTVINRLEELEPLALILEDSGESVEIHTQENQYTPGWYWLTVHSEKATKDRAMRALAESAGLTNGPITAFGDNTNDLKMLKAADCGIAVENALPEVKAVADKIIGHHGSDSVVRFIAEENGLELL
ncbi:MAG: HAD hydrolase family protein [Spirochaetales bacterium]|nr:HAD hydrolase family protein [Spirochaetales bacterium]